MDFRGLISSALIPLFVAAGVPVPAYCYKAELTNIELDSVYVGGFEFNINAAYAFRSAVVNQSNIAAVACGVAALAIDNVVINATNQAILKNEGDSAVANQLNISTVLAKIGDINNVKISNKNIADITNVFTPGDNGGVISEALSMVSTPDPVNPLGTVSGTAQAGTQAADTIAAALTVGPVLPDAVKANSSLASNLPVARDPLEIVAAVTPILDIVSSVGESFIPGTESSDTGSSTVPADSVLPAQEIAAAPAGSQPPVAALDPAAAETLKINEVTAQASAVAAQTNIALVLAPNGNINNVEINNSNIANIDNKGNSGLAVQTNIAVALAGGVIANTKIINSNIADIKNQITTDIGRAMAKSVSSTGPLGNFNINNVFITSQSVASQLNITFVTSLGSAIKDHVHELLANKLVNAK